MPIEKAVKTGVGGEFPQLAVKNSGKLNAYRN